MSEIESGTPFGELEKINTEESEQTSQETNNFWMDAEQERLASTPIHTQEQLKGEYNDIRIITFETGDKAIFKPALGERLQREFVENGTYFKRERAAYLVNHALGFDLVPTTVIRDIDGEIGSVQAFVTDAKEVWQVDEEKYQEELFKLWVFDYIVWNSDRNDSNLLFQGDQVRAIDNALTFGPDDLKTYTKHHEETVPEEIIMQYETFLSNQSLQEQLWSHLSELLPDEEIEACSHRVMHLGNLLRTQRAVYHSDELEYNPSI